MHTWRCALACLQQENLCGWKDLLTTVSYQILTWEAETQVIDGAFPIKLLKEQTASEVSRPAILRGWGKSALNYADTLHVGIIICFYVYRFCSAMLLMQWRDYELEDYLIVLYVVTYASHFRKSLICSAWVSSNRLGAQRILGSDWTASPFSWYPNTSEYVDACSKLATIG